MRRFAVALRAYRDAHGALPSTLEALVPTSLTEVPVDARQRTPLPSSAQERRLGGLDIPF